MPRLALRASALLTALALPALALTGACSDEPAGGASYLLIELVPFGGNSLGKVSAAYVAVKDDKGNPLTNLCVNLDGAPGEVVGSFVLERAASKPANVRATVEVTPFTLSGSETAGVGEEFACGFPTAPLGKTAVLHVDFCPGQPKILRFNVGAECPTACESDRACGAGIGVDGKNCPETACCPSRTPTACSLENEI